MKPTHIAVATDFSDTARHAVEVARRLASHEGARVSLIHVFDPAPLAPAVAYPLQVWTGSELEREMRARALETLERIRREVLGDLPDVGLVALHHASPVGAICDHAETQGVDLIVSGTRGHGGIDHLLLGSVAERLIRHAPCSVLTVRTGGDVAQFPHHLLVATDLSPAAEVAVDQAAELARRFASRVTLCHVRPDAASWRGGRNGDEAAQRRALDALASRFDQGAAVALVTGDDPAEILADLARERDADLLVVGSHGRTGLARMLIGSVAERAARLAPRAVLVTRR